MLKKIIAWTVLSVAFAFLLLCLAVTGIMAPQAVLTMGLSFVLAYPIVVLLIWAVGVVIS